MTSAHTPQSTTVTGWGRSSSATVRSFEPKSSAELQTISLPHANLIARGLGRSYGDAAQRSNGNVLLTTACDRSEWIDRAGGVVRVDAGATIGDLISRFAPKGWFVPVSPGTRYVTVGGAIAADIHGKNHHVDGSFGNHVRAMRVRLASDEIVELTPSSDPDLFWATVGGMGLTGIIIDADVALQPIPSTTVEVETQRFATLNPLLEEMRRSDANHTFSVAWVDLLGGARSVLTQGSFAMSVEGPAGHFKRPTTPQVGLPPVPIPRVAITPAVRVFNEMWWRKAPRDLAVSHETITAFFHPLDAISDWNRVYGRNGFVQWQCVIPDDATQTLVAITDLLGQLPAFFTVLKRFGAANLSPLSFPMTGWTLAVDLPATPRVLADLPALDRLVVSSGGRLYLAKDARLDREAFESMYPRLSEFKAVRARVDPEGRFMSDLALRLGL